MNKNNQPNASFTLLLLVIGFVTLLLISWMNFKAHRFAGYQSHNQHQQSVMEYFE